jgi:small-conductance mechanosensitive channel
MLENIFFKTENMSATSSENNFSNYGVYTVTDLLELKLPDTEIRVEELGDSSVNIQVLVWHPREDWS